MNEQTGRCPCEFPSDPHFWPQNSNSNYLSTTTRCTCSEQHLLLWLMKASIFYVLLHLTGYINTPSIYHSWYFLAVTLFSSGNVHALTHVSQNCELFLPLQITMLISFMSYEMFTTKYSSFFEECCHLFWRKKTQITPQPRYSLQQHFAHMLNQRVF